MKKIFFVLIFIFFNTSIYLSALAAGMSEADAYAAVEEACGC